MIFNSIVSNDKQQCLNWPIDDFKLLLTDDRTLDTIILRNLDMQNIIFMDSSHSS